MKINKCGFVLLNHNRELVTDQLFPYAVSAEDFAEGYGLKTFHVVEATASFDYDIPMTANELDCLAEWERKLT